MGFKEAVRTCLREKYFTLQGRASRSEYWYFYLFAALCWIAMIAAFVLLGGIGGFENGQFSALTFVVGAICFVGFIYLLIPTITAQVRRFHDRNLSGWWVLVGILVSNVPYIGAAASTAILVITVLKGTDGDNKYGPDPLKTQNSAEVFA